ncbi:MAG: alpha/beta fold hydrolase [Bacteroidetes bacterium]|nr:alpha/beta fold hydrolase [Bacteroidota bacterium]
MKLFYRKYGETGPPLIIVHGLYGSGDNWVTLARELSERFEVYVIDQRNHGLSPHSDAFDYPTMRDDLKMLMDAEGIEQAVLIGHSMGAKAIMYFAASWPDRVLSLVSVDMAPRAYHDQALDYSSAANHGKMIDAMLELELDRYSNREEVGRALAPKIGSERVRGFLLKNLRREKNGSLAWRINLPVFRSNLPRILDGLLDGENNGPGGLQEIPRGGFTGFPALFIAGEKSDYIRAEDHQLIRTLFPGAQIVTIPGAGHWIHSEQPRLLLKNLNYFLEV